MEVGYQFAEAEPKDIWEGLGGSSLSPGSPEEEGGGVQAPRSVIVAARSWAGIGAPLVSRPSHCTSTLVPHPVKERISVFVSLNGVKVTFQLRGVAHVA